MNIIPWTYPDIIKQKKSKIIYTTQTCNCNRSCRSV